MHQTLSLQNNTTHAIAYQISCKLLRMDVLTSKTCWAVNNEIIKQVTSSWSLFIQLFSNMFHIQSINSVHKTYKQPTHGNQFYVIFLFIIFSPTCFGQHSSHLQGYVFYTTIQLQLNVSPSLHNIKNNIVSVAILL